MSKLSHPEQSTCERRKTLRLRTAVIVLLSAAFYGVIFYNFIQGAAFAQSGIFPVFSIAWWVAVAALIWVDRIHLPAKLAGVYWLGSTLLACIAGLIMIIILTNQRFWREISWYSFGLNVMLLLYVTLSLQLLLGRKRLPIVLLMGFCLVFGIANYYVHEFKGNLVHPNDLSAWKTGLDVVGSYQFTVPGTIALDTLAGVLVLIMAGVNPTGFREAAGAEGRRQKLLRSGTGLCALVLGLVVLNTVELKDAFGVTMDAWNPDNNYRMNGPVLGFVMEQQAAKIQKPEGYSQADAEALLESYDQTSAGDVLPTLICIMNESYVDLSVRGPLDTSEEMEQWNAIEDYIEKGYVYASVSGGGTCNSEFEFLTGNSMMNLASSSYPYQSYKLDNVFSIPKMLKELGYETAGFHPGNAPAWNRNRVYPALGFDTSTFVSDMEKQDYIDERINYVSDASNYEKMLEIYRGMEKPAFIFNVTIQNHGSYEMDTMQHLNMVDPQGYGQYLEVTAFRSLVRESSVAFYDLIEYFRQVEEPVIICMFGDHMPNLDKNFLAELEAAADSLEQVEPLERVQNGFKTPYLIWANYDTGVSPRETETSINYLAAHILEIAGIRADYTDYLLELEEQYPVINSHGYRTPDGQWHWPDETQEALQEYANLEYYMITR